MRQSMGNMIKRHNKQFLKDAVDVIKDELQVLDIWSEDNKFKYKKEILKIRELLNKLK
jgi:hypothetical protein